MIVKSRIDKWGIINLEVSGESVHENTLLNLITARDMTQHYSAESAGTDIPATTHLILEFRVRESKSAVAEKVAG